jgi:hypothetical protein
MLDPEAVSNSSVICYLSAPMEVSNSHPPPLHVQNLLKLAEIGRPKTQKVEDNRRPKSAAEAGFKTGVNQERCDGSGTEIHQSPGTITSQNDIHGVKRTRTEV